MPRKPKPCPACLGTGCVQNQRKLGAEMRKLREQQGMTAYRVSLFMKISTGHLSGLESGKKRWNPKLVAKFRKALTK